MFVGFGALRFGIMAIISVVTSLGSILMMISATHDRGNYTPMEQIVPAFKWKYNDVIEDFESFGPGSPRKLTCDRHPFLPFPWSD